MSFDFLGEKSCGANLYSKTEENKTKADNRRDRDFTTFTFIRSLTVFFVFDIKVGRILNEQPRIQPPLFSQIHILIGHPLHVTTMSTCIISRTRVLIHPGFYTFRQTSYTVVKPLSIT